MDRVHKRLTTEQVKVLLKGYHDDRDGFSITYQREGRPRLPASVEAEIEKELMLEKNLIDGSTLPTVTCPLNEFAKVHF
jgi:hypothetical protein